MPIDAQGSEGRIDSTTSHPSPAVSVPLTLIGDELQQSGRTVIMKT